MSAPKLLIDAAIQYYDGTLGPQDLLASPRRLFLLLALQHTHNTVWMMRDWSGSMIEAAITADPGDNFGALPDDFLRFTPSGGLFEPSRNRRMHERQMYEIANIRNTNPSAAGQALDVFAIFDHKVQLPFASSSQRDFMAFYQYKPPTLEDQDSNAFTPFIDKYADTVLLPGLVMRGQEMKADARKTWLEQWNAGIALMIENERPVQTSLRKPPMTRGMW